MDAHYLADGVAPLRGDGASGALSPFVPLVFFFERKGVIWAFVRTLFRSSVRHISPLPLLFFQKP